MHLVCHENIPGTGYARGAVVTDPVAIAAIKENDALFKHFSQVPDGTFPSPSAPAPVVAKVFVAPPAPTA